MFKLLKKLMVSVADLNIFHWLTLVLITIFSFHFIYVKTIKTLLLKVGLKRKHVILFIDTIWQLSFLILCLPMVFVCLEDSILVSWVKRLDKELTKCKVHEETTVKGINTVFIMITAFSLHDILNTWITRGFKNLDFFQKQVFFSIFVLTCYSKCSMFGLTLYFVSMWATTVELGTKLCFFAAQYTKSQYLWTLANVLFGFSVMIWIYTYLYIYPVFLTYNKTVNSSMMKAELNMLIVLDFLSWIYLVAATINSMFTRLVLSCVMSSKEYPQSLKFILFGCDPWTLLVSSKRFHVLNKDEIFVSNIQRNMLKLRAAINCRNAIMRKVNRMRADKSTKQKKTEGGEEVSSTSNTDYSSSCSSPLRQTSPPSKNSTSS